MTLNSQISARCVMEESLEEGFGFEPMLVSVCFRG